MGKSLIQAVPCRASATLWAKVNCFKNLEQQVFYRCFGCVVFQSAQQHTGKALCARSLAGSRVTRRQHTEGGGGSDSLCFSGYWNSWETTNWINKRSPPEWQRTVIFYKMIPLLPISSATGLPHLLWDPGAGPLSFSPLPQCDAPCVSRGQGRALLGRGRGFSRSRSRSPAPTANSAWGQAYLSPSLPVSSPGTPIRWCLNRFLPSGTPSLTRSLPHPFRGFLVNLRVNWNWKLFL